MEDKKFYLRDWYISLKVVWGKVYNNPKFRDGHIIHTSEIRDVLPFGDGLFLIETANSKYYVEMSSARFKEFDNLGKSKIIGFEKFECMYMFGEEK